MRFATQKDKGRGGARHPCQAAFTLAEVMAALLFLAIVIPTAVEALQIASRAGEVAARMNLGKNRGFGVDEGKGEGIHRSGGPSIHDAVAMPDYLASKKGSNSFPADHISGALHFLTGNDFAGHTVRRVKG